ncbi:MAG TPA: S-adenosylmethionine:tRNA ribosyltransferase-isomerase [Acidimicrobiales bacterium]
MTAVLELLDPLRFELPPALEASEPPEASGRRRDDVRLMVAWRNTGKVAHVRFSDLANYLEPGDVLVVNTSATVPAAVDTTAPPLSLHFSTPLPGASDLRVVELRREGLQFEGGEAGMAVGLPGGASVTLLAPYGTPGRLWIASLQLPADACFHEWLEQWGRPIRYRHVPRRWPLAHYQTVFAVEPGSAEMPSAARPFTFELVTALVSRGVTFAPLLLHAGVSSQEAHELPYPEYYRVGMWTADLVNDARRRGSRVIAVGTTAVRALETVVDKRGRVHPGSGWTDVVVTPARGVRAVDGMITGWHEPQASHLAMLEAIAGRPLLERSYMEALAARYRWHEFGDSHLILP